MKTALQGQIHVIYSWDGGEMVVTCTICGQVAKRWYTFMQQLPRPVTRGEAPLENTDL